MAPLLTICSIRHKPRKQVLCTYDGNPRVICPIILGHTNGQEIALAYQFAGESKSGLPPQGQWKCFWLSKVDNVQLRDGPWYDGDSHTVDLDINPDSPYQPKRRLRPLRRRTIRRRGANPRR